MTELIDRLIQATGLSKRDLLNLIATAPRRYKTYRVPKRNGKGYRTISQPARELKAIQRALLEGYLKDLPVHQAAMAYRAEHSIRDNALAHVENGPILKLDFSDFFPSIRPVDWHRYCDDRGLFKDEEERRQTTRILFHYSKQKGTLCLAIGAPTSPHLSNLLMFEFDAAISAAVSEDYVTYTRYADDLTFSAKRTGYLVNVEKQTKKILKKLSWPRRLQINASKTVLATRRYHRQVTGLVLSNQSQVSIGHERKRRISAAVHHALHGKLTTEQLAQLSGMLAFVNAVEPTFLAILEKKYGSAVLGQIKAAPRQL